MELYHYIENRGKIFILKYTVVETPKMYRVTNTEVIRGGLNNALLVSRFGKSGIFKTSLDTIMGKVGILNYYATENSQSNYNDFVIICINEYKELQRQKEAEIDGIKGSIKNLEGEII